MKYFNLKNVIGELFLVVLFLPLVGFSQTLEEADSLEKIINNYEKIDENYVRLRNSFVVKKLFLTPSDSTWLSYNLKTLAIAEELDYKEGLVLAYGNIALIYQYLLLEPYTAIDYNLKSLKIIEQHKGLSIYAVPTLHNIGLLYYEQQEYDKALVYLKDTLEKIKKSPKENLNTEVVSKYYSSLLVNLGNIYAEFNKLDSSAYYFRNGILESERVNNYLFGANAKSGLGIVLAKLGKIKEAKRYIEESLNMVDKYNLEFIRVPTYINASEVYLADKKLEKAEDYAFKVLTLNKSFKNLTTESSTWETLSKIYISKKDYKNAFHALEKHITFKDSLTSSDRRLEISRKEIQFEADKKQLLAEEEIKRQKLIKNSSLLAGGSIIAILVFGAFLYKRKREAEFNLQTTSAELKALRAQLNPHFVFNALNSIGNYMTDKSKDEAKQYLDQFSGLMRQTLENSEKTTVLLEEDIELLKAYIDIEKKRFSDSFDYEINIDNTLDKDNIKVPSMIIQPFVENSILHGFSEIEQGGIIKIEIKEYKGMLLYIVDDNGKGRQQKLEDSSKEKHAFGTKITKNRIDILNEKKQANINLRIIDKEKGTRVEVYIPLEKKFKDD